MKTLTITLVVLVGCGGSLEPPGNAQEAGDAATPSLGQNEAPGAAEGQGGTPSDSSPECVAAMCAYEGFTCGIPWYGRCTDSAVTCGTCPGESACGDNTTPDSPSQAQHTCGNLCESLSGTKLTEACAEVPGSTWGVLGTGDNRCGGTPWACNPSAPGTCDPVFRPNGTAGCTLSQGYWCCP
jgi:hypothetical protein